jgi:hypothetical protein
MEFQEIKELFEIGEDSVGFTENEISKAENRLGIKFPKILKRYYSELGKHQKLNHTQNDLINLENLKIDEFGILIIYMENQGVVIWGIDTKEEIIDNPKVLMNYDQEWVIATNNLKSFLKSMAYFQALFASEFNANRGSISEKELKYVKNNFGRIGGGIAFWNGEFYQNKKTELIAIFSLDYQVNIVVTANNKEDFEILTDNFEMEWDYNSLADE